MRYGKHRRSTFLGDQVIVSHGLSNPLGLHSGPASGDLKGLLLQADRHAAVETRARLLQKHQLLPGGSTRTGGGAGMPEAKNQAQQAQHRKPESGHERNPAAFHYSFSQTVLRLTRYLLIYRLADDRFIGMPFDCSLIPNITNQRACAPLLHYRAKPPRSSVPWNRDRHGSNPAPVRRSCSSKRGEYNSASPQ